MIRGLRLLLIKKEKDASKERTFEQFRLNVLLSWTLRGYTVIKITETMQHIVIESDEAYTLRIELEDAFCEIDKKTNRGAYSLKNIYKISPRMAELYSTIGNQR